VRCGSYVRSTLAATIGTVGCRALCEASAETGALPQLRRLHLYRNIIDRFGAVALGRSLQDWGFPSCTQIVLDGNPEVSQRACRFVVDSLGRREWARTALRLWRHHTQQSLRRRAARRGDRTVALPHVPGASASTASSAPAMPRSQTKLPTIALAEWRISAITT